MRVNITKNKGSSKRESQEMVFDVVLPIEILESYADYSIEAGLKNTKRFVTELTLGNATG